MAKRVLTAAELDAMPLEEFDSVLVTLRHNPNMRTHCKGVQMPRVSCSVKDGVQFVYVSMFCSWGYIEFRLHDREAKLRGRLADGTVVVVEQLQADTIVGEQEYVAAEIAQNAGALRLP